jgi:hypothetical protein
MSTGIQTLKKALDFADASIQVRRQVFPRRVIDLVAIFPEIGEIIVPLYPSQARELGECLIELSDGWDENETGDLN